ncbi:MAG: hypothetical protein KAS75_08230 [Planctomycetes bacterium]|nr:hypothetical protein [Planctomycetota bacterium]
MKRVGLIFLGFVSIVIVYLLLILVGEKFFPNTNTEGCHGPSFSALLIAMPIAFLMGSVVTGYFSYYEFESKWGLIWMAPILYFNLSLLGFATLQFLLDSFIEVNDTSIVGFLSGLWFPFLIGLVWYLASLAGVVLGYLLRGRIVRW